MRQLNTVMKNGNCFVKIGVIGYVYNIYDDANILGRLVELGAETVTFETLDNSSIEAQLQHLPKSLFWSFSNKLLAGGYVFLEDSSIDGVIHITSFGCGPDAFLGKYFELDFEQYSKPFMTIRVDEHSGDNHLQTRIEAFVDMIVQKKSAKAAVQ
jgi:predicted nucleotide-binding protein (sugar kinase/HSP70/actin superfamily)